MIAHVVLTNSYALGFYKEAQLSTILKKLSDSKQLKSEIKAEYYALHERTKEVIENELSDADIHELLTTKWIDSLLQNLNKLPMLIVDDFIEKVEALKRKYATTLVDVEQEIHATSLELSTMIDDLRGNEYDMQALSEFKKLLQNI